MVTNCLIIEQIIQQWKKMLQQWQTPKGTGRDFHLEFNRNYEKRPNHSAVATFQ